MTLRSVLMAGCRRETAEEHCSLFTVTLYAAQGRSWWRLIDWQQRYYGSAGHCVALPSPAQGRSAVRGDRFVLAWRTWKYARSGAVGCPTLAVLWDAEQSCEPIGATWDTPRWLGRRRGWEPQRALGFILAIAAAVPVWPGPCRSGAGCGSRAG